MVSLQNYVTVIEKENERTRAECNRLARIVDSGEWDKQRISDLEHASQLLSGERDALTKLIGRLQRQNSSAVEQQQQQEDDIRNLKDQILGNNFMNRNKMLVKGASSFNSVVRAIKSDVLKKGVDPELLYSIDKMSMDQVSVFPDGEIRVKPLSKFDKGKWNSRLVYNSETTKAFAGDESDRISSSPRNSPLRRTLSHQQRGLSPTRIPREGFASSRIVHDLEI
ncbi:hypothetical protein O6H91_Y031700 [Diphasiastrum complanatum]|nr:hypothetical protein O6H91_Y031700 [Diphasiastrum complanatum]